VKHRLLFFGLALFFLLGALALFVVLGRQDDMRQELEQRRAAQQLHAELSSQIAAVIDRHERILMDQLEQARQNPEARTPALGERLLLDAKNQRVLPVDGEADAFLHRLQPVWQNGRAFETSDRERDSNQVDRGSRDIPNPITHGWRRWYWEEGANFLFFMDLAGGGQHATEQSRAFMVELLLNAINIPAGETARVDDSAGQALHIGANIDPDGPSHFQAPLPSPLEIWTLGVQAPGGANRGWSMRHWLPLLLLGLGLLVLYLLREMQRSLREAGQQVSFVNQVSHELKTPLTNIRLYAELLQGRVGDDPKAVQQLDVVVSESHRLTRLIHNVLSFAQAGRKEIELHQTHGVPDEVIEQVLNQFRPNLSAAGLTLHTELAAKNPATFDPDVLRQILGNLLTNAEKYAASGGALQLRSEQQERKLGIHVIDRGPGIPPGLRKKIFEPFMRVSKGLSDATGTGIGLSISRQLARLHGGDVTLLPSESGSHFCVTLETKENG